MEFVDDFGNVIQFDYTKYPKILVTKDEIELYGFPVNFTFASSPYQSRLYHFQLLNLDSYYTSNYKYRARIARIYKIIDKLWYRYHKYCKGQDNRRTMIVLKKLDKMFVIRDRFELSTTCYVG